MMSLLLVMFMGIAVMGNPVPETTTIPTTPIAVVVNNATNASTTFNERRRDMFFDNYTPTKVDIIDTTKVNLTQFIEEREKQHQPQQPPLQGTLPRCITPEGTVQEISPVVVNSPEAINNNFLNTNISAKEFEESGHIHPHRRNILVPRTKSGRPSCLEASGFSFCESVDNYPKHIIRDEIGISPTQYQDLFGIKEIDGRKSFGIGNDDEEPGEEALCSRSQKIAYPRVAQNLQKQWMYIVNEPDYEQAIFIETCTSPKEACNSKMNLPFGMTSRCKQKFAIKKMLTLHPTEKRTYPEVYKFPTCCVCMLINGAPEYWGRNLDVKPPVETNQTPEKQQQQPREAPKSEEKSEEKQTTKQSQSQTNVTEQINASQPAPQPAPNHHTEEVVVVNNGSNHN